MENTELSPHGSGCKQPKRSIDTNFGLINTAENGLMVGININRVLHIDKDLAKKYLCDTLDSLYEEWKKEIEKETL